MVTRSRLRIGVRQDHWIHRGISGCGVQAAEPCTGFGVQELGEASSTHLWYEKVLVQMDKKSKCMPDFIVEEKK